MNMDRSCRAAFGILVIDKDPVAESEFWAMAPPGVIMNTARFESPRKPGTSDYGEDPARVVAESSDVARGLDFLGQMRLDVICVCFTTSSFFGGVDFDKTFAEQARGKAHGTPVVTAAQATIAAMNAVGITRPFVVIPPWFKDEIAEAGRGYFIQAGFEPSGLHRFKLGRGWRDLQPWETWDAGAQWAIHHQEVYQQVRRAVPTSSDGVVIAGNGFRCIDAIHLLEADLGLPVITSNQACLWHCLHRAAVSATVPGYGRLFATGSEAVV